MPQQGYVLRHVVRLANRGWLLLALTVGNAVACATAFGLIEGTIWFQSLYWTVVSGFTIGYGDVLPKTPEGKVLAMYVMISFWFLLLLVAAKIITLLILDADKFTHEEQEELKEDLRTARQALAGTNDKLNLLLDNLLTEEEQRDLLTTVRRIEATVIPR